MLGKAYMHTPISRDIPFANHYTTISEPNSNLGQIFYNSQTWDLQDIINMLSSYWTSQEKNC